LTANLRWSMDQLRKKKNQGRKNEVEEDFMRNLSEENTRKKTTLSCRYILYTFRTPLTIGIILIILSSLIPLPYTTLPFKSTPP